LAVMCIVQKSRPSLNVKVKGQRSRSLKTKKRKVWHFVQELSSGERSSCFYSGGNISACWLVHLN